MPFKNEHSARQNNPNKYTSFKRRNDEFGKGVDVIYGVKPDGTVEIQTIRFDKTKFSKEEAIKWLKARGYKTTQFEEAEKMDIKKDIDIPEELVENEKLKRVLYNAMITHISFVDKGANNKSFFMMKDQEPTLTKEIEIIKANSDFNRVYGIVYSPNEVDLHGDTMTASEIEKAQSVFMKNFQNIDLQHDFKTKAGYLVESAIALQDMAIGEHTITKGSWYIATEPTPEIKEAIVKGEITGYSMAGKSDYKEVRKEEKVKEEVEEIIEEIEDIKIDGGVIRKIRRMLNLDEKEITMEKQEIVEVVKSVLAEIETEKAKSVEFEKSEALKTQQAETIKKLQEEIIELKKELGKSKQQDDIVKSEDVVETETKISFF